MTGIREFISALFSPKAPPPKPVDLQKFEQARSDLVKSARALSREADAFGAMLKEMSAPRKKKTTNGAKRK